MKETGPLGHLTKYEKLTKSRWSMDYVIFGPMGLAVSIWISVLGMFLIGMTCTFLFFQCVLDIANCLSEQITNLCSSI